MSVRWAILVVIVSVVGCERPLFPVDLAHTPYERYQQLHGGRRPMTEQNAYGGEQPALRERLKRLDAP